MLKVSRDLSYILSPPGECLSFFRTSRLLGVLTILAKKRQEPAVLAVDAGHPFFHLFLALIFGSRMPGIFRYLDVLPTLASKRN